MGRPSVRQEAAVDLRVVGGSGAEFCSKAQQYGDRVLWRPVRCAGYETDAQGVRHYHHLENIPCKCPLGPQVYQFWTTAFETLCGGGRGSGKTESVLGFLLFRGNPEIWKCGKAADVAYINDPDYKFLVVRRDQTDLDAFFGRMRRMFAPAGPDFAKFTENPLRVRFSTGAEGFFGHLKDPDSILKYQGKQFTRIAVEEAGQIVEEKWYLDGIVMSCRSPQPHLHPQVLLTANPGGPGAKWLNARFRYPHNGSEPWPEKKHFVCPATGLTRMWVHSTVLDNPYFCAGDREYVRSLQTYKTTDPTRFRQWYLGDFDALEGQFFATFRHKPHFGEPDNARHVLACEKHPDGSLKRGPIELASWWPRAIGCDWGYNHATAVAWGCWTPKRQLHVYREAKFNHLGTVEVGAAIAKMSLPDLEVMDSPHLIVHLSHDAFHRENYALTEAEQIKQGIDEVLGGEAAFVVAPNLDEESMEKEAAWASVEQRRRTHGHRAVITLMPAGGPRKRKPGWQLLVEYLRWWSVTESPEDRDRHAMQILKTKGVLAYQEYLKREETEGSRVLPVLQIWDVCPHTIAGLESAQMNPNDTDDVLKVEGDDFSDMMNYLVSGFGFNAGEKPQEVWIAERVRQITQTRDLGMLVHANRQAEWEWKQRNTAHAVRIPRIPATARRLAGINFGAVQ